MIEVDGLTKRYGEKLAIQDVTFDVRPGEILGFLGPNGAGKSTTMRILAGYMPASSGRATIAGFDVFDQSLEARRRIGYLPENVPLYTEMAVKDYLGFMAEIRGVPRANRRQRVDYAMQASRVADRADWIIGKLSRGYRQRVGLAQAIVHNPPVLILDEPTAGLDPRQIIETRNLIRGLGGERTIILSTHILPEVSATCSRVVIIANGRVVAEDTPANLTKRLRGSERVELEVAGPVDKVRAKLGALPNVLNVETGPEAADGRSRLFVDCAVGNDIRAELAATVVKSGWSLYQLRNVGMSLEEVFLQLTTQDAAEPEATPRPAPPGGHPAPGTEPSEAVPSR
ncbi:MAG TPA: ATP-binding cassette domain-containing protein [Chloroflexota bacterium]|jgi:ABC-2 type transport system ATP-binding protein|nr:ATP-binding cassette domain-containing protein [Chloroflexota bacterium]